MSPLMRLQLLDELINFNFIDKSFVLNQFIYSLHDLEVIQEKSLISKLQEKYSDLVFSYFKRFYVNGDHTIYHYRLLASKTYYFSGFDLLNSGKTTDALDFWDVARNISKDWDYFQIEAASMQYHIFKHPKLAEQILTECLENEYAKESCLNQLKLPFEYLPLPGSYREKILELNLY